MSLSSHELIMVLRARDEASRVLRGFTNNLGRFEKSAAAEQIAAINATRDADLVAGKARLASLAATQAGNKDLIRSYRDRITTIRLEQRDIKSRYDLEVQRIKASQSLSDEAKRRELTALKSVYVTAKTNSAERITDLERQIQMQNSLNAAIVNERMAIKSANAEITSKAATDAMIVRRDEAERTYKQEQKLALAHKKFNAGMATATAGVGVAALGVAAAYGLNQLTKASADYTEQAAKTKTQADKFKISLAEIKDMGRQVAGELPVDFGQVQDSMYDILSSLDLVGKNTKEKKRYFLDLTKGIATAAVAGKTDMETAGRSIIQILNAWGKESGGINKVNDIMFQLVRKGVGTYDQFAKSIGRAVPSARKASASVADLAGMMAFLTRNGLSTAQAATSAARAYDVLAKGKAKENFKDIGINIVGANGKFKSMSAVMTELKDKFKGLSDAQRAVALEKLFAGTGNNIQAMRFFNLAVKDSSGNLQSLTKDMRNAKGATKDAYAVMANTPEAAARDLNNQYQIMATTIGDDLIPVKVELMKALSSLLKWFNGLDPEIRKNVAMFALVVAVLLPIIGVVLIVVGGIAMLAAAAAALGIGLGALIGIIAAVVAAIALVAVGVYMVITNWGPISAWFTNLWNTVLTGITSAWTSISTFFSTLWSTYIQPYLSALWESLQTAVATAMTVIIAIFKGDWQFIPLIIASGVIKIWNFMMAGTANMRQAIAAWFTNMMSAAAAGAVNLVNWFKNLPNTIKSIFNGAKTWLYQAGISVLTGFLNGLKDIWNNITTWVGDIGQWIKDHKGPISYDLKLLVPAGKAIMQGFHGSLQKGFEKTKRYIKSATNDLGGAIGGGGGTFFGGGSSTQPPAYGNYKHVEVKSTINTQEINPKKHAADLGYEIASVLGV